MRCCCVLRINARVPPRGTSWGREVSVPALRSCRRLYGVTYACAPWGTSPSFGRSSPFPVVRVEVMPAAGTAPRGHCPPLDRISPFPVVRVDAKHAAGTAPRGHTSTKCAEALRSYATDFSTETEILGKRFGCLLKTH